LGPPAGRYELAVETVSEATADDAKRMQMQALYLDWHPFPRPTMEKG
jgi:hypothetical protein